MLRCFSEQLDFDLGLTACRTAALHTEPVVDGQMQVMLIFLQKITLRVDIYKKRCERCRVAGTAVLLFVEYKDRGNLAIACASNFSE